MGTKVLEIKSYSTPQSVRIALVHSLEALQEIVRLVEVSSDQVRSIATASEQQSAASEEINHSIEEINRISSETAGSMTHSFRSVAELSTQVDNLRRLIDTLKRGD